MLLTQLREIYDTPFFDLISRARASYLEHWSGNEVQLCTLLSIKTGGCSEDCGYCAQSARYHTGVKAERLMETDAVMEVARRAKENGSTRFCMGAAWKGVREGDAKFEQVLGTIREVSKLGMEVCVTLGQLSPGAARQLKDAGVTAYNHNIDTSPEFYPEIVTTHTFQDRLNTIEAVQQAGMDVCCGGIIGLGETVEDRLKMLEVLTNFDPAPESVPINCLMSMPGTPLEAQPAVEVFELVRLIATTRLALPSAKVRLSAGRTRLSKEAQALCFFAGANSIFYGDKLLTAGNPGVESDRALFAELDLVPQASRCAEMPEAVAV
ncbi:MAG TPA: biotin synthase BioB [Chthoniobacteraceae bacterium]|jgi:biotin synthase|nr:biotin synthase BioB [Chthoniobacteraceae bacterium]